MPFIFGQREVPTQKVALCALQASLLYPNITGWIQNNCSSRAGQLWDDTDIRLQNWTGITWQLRNLAWRVTAINLSQVFPRIR